MDPLTHRHAADGPCVQRDDRGNLRSECGTGLIIATPYDTRDQVQEWAENVSGAVSRTNYLAALAVIDAELAGGFVPSPTWARSTTLHVGLRACAAVTELRALANRVQENGPSDDLATELTRIAADLAADRPSIAV